MVHPSIDEELVRKVTQQVITRLNQPPSIQSSPSPAPVQATGGSPSGDKKLVLCNLSVRHIHLCREHVDILYGSGAELEVRNELYQPGQYASKQTVTLVGPRMRCLGEVRVLGPLRPSTQVEVSRTDAIYLGIDPPVKPSGNHEGSVGLILVGPVGVVHLKKGVILANRHVHVSVASAQKWGLKDNQYVSVRVNTTKKTLMEDVQIRVHPEFLDEMHLDTDDGNACGLRGGELVEIIV